jgi:type I restriction enzyme M protein
LFIEACYKFLKPGGKVAIVLPDGILGNPNTLPVREWILDKFKILASVDLAVEAFLPQVGVQASLLFLQRKTELERQLVQDSSEDYEVFMAIAEKLGKDRRGNPIYMRDDDGAEIIFDTETNYVVRKREGSLEVKTRKEKLKHLDDDLPLISKEYSQFLKG